MPRACGQIDAVLEARVRRFMLANLLVLPLAIKPTCGRDPRVDAPVEPGGEEADHACASWREAGVASTGRASRWTPDPRCLSIGVATRPMELGMNDSTDDLSDVDVKIAALKIVVSKVVAELEKLALSFRQTALSEMDEALGMVTAEIGHLRKGNAVRTAVRKIVAEQNADAVSTQRRQDDE